MAQEQEWHHKGSSCCSPFGTCMLSCCCPCITYGRAKYRVKNDGNMNGYSCCNMPCVGFTFLSCLGFSFILPMINRGDMRAKYHLQGNGCKDCLCACFCTPCDVTQQDKESEFREEQKHTLMQPGKVDQMHYGRK
ncbi:PLAC8-domain-containing protein [Aaosphaeria arxii CBS 175.79]|uniref:PLAC8-domain-containing protein n=1 Tax=Aaosphaeria arxii CBS 175.79 TaxID=1450172 RepID=A0A6A5Y4D8_9PLEO|nr:PLAC8-domain-containing protein [Aaosphaeria arxii CBS 175.79]KAF2020139.1 PLAC8-domain-containing protein [Aaosphaeria arxii CBS 175.79]